MTLPLPYVLGDDQDPIQGNFDELKQQFPLSRRHMKIEQPHLVGNAGEPAFQNSWVNFGGVFEPARFWKDPMGLVHIGGVVKSGASATAVFTLPAGWRPGFTIVAGSDMNSFVHSRIDVQSDVQVFVRFGTGGTNVYASLNIPPFKQEQ